MINRWSSPKREDIRPGLETVSMHQERSNSFYAVLLKYAKIDQANETLCWQDDLND